MILGFMVGLVLGWVGSITFRRFKRRAELRRFRGYFSEADLVAALSDMAANGLRNASYGDPLPARQGSEDKTNKSNIVRFPNAR